jgi:hypothetical protein
VLDEEPPDESDPSLVEEPPVPESSMPVAPAAESVDVDSSSLHAAVIRAKETTEPVARFRSVVEVLIQRIHCLLSCPH